MRTDVKRRLNEVAADGLWSSSDLNTRINRAMLRVYMDTELDTTTASINLRVNVAWYSLPTDCLIPKFLYGPAIWSQQRLFPTDMIHLDKAERLWEIRSGSISTHFIPFSYDRFILWPAAGSTTTVALFYVPTPTTLSSDSDTTALPLGAQKLVPIYAAYLALRRENFDKAGLFLAEYKSRLEGVNAEQRNQSVFHTTKLRPAGKFEKGHGNVKFGRRVY